MKSIRFIMGGATLFGLFLLMFFAATRSMVLAPESGPLEAAAVKIVSTLNYLFQIDGTLYEAGSMKESTSPYYWVNSGAELISRDGIGSTVMGELPAGDKWQLLYAANNPLDTDNGVHPQNIFRLITKGQWDNAHMEAKFRIVGDHFSASPNRNASNGLLLMSRYRDGGQTLYYAGVRVDGTAVIKKKYRGTYYTMAQAKIFPGTYSLSDINLLPHGSWITLIAETRTAHDGSVTVSLAMQEEGSASTTPLVAAVDNGQYGGTPPITGKSYAGIRTDFMDVEFDDYLIKPL
jgi:hypothetical protein